MKMVHSNALGSVGAAVLAILAAACGAYTTDGSGGSSGSATGGSTGSGGASESGGATGSGGTTTGSGGETTGSGGVSESGGTTTGSGGATTGRGGSTTGRGGATAGSGGSTTGTGGSTTGRGGATTGSGGSTTGTGGSSTGTGGSSGGVALPCDIFNKVTGNKCVSAHSTVRVIVSSYTGPLYQLCKGTANTGPSSCKGTTQDVASKDGYADVAAHDAFCPAGTACTITKIYDQSGQKNDLEPSPKGGVCGPDKPSNAGDLKVTINGHSAYGVLIKPGMGYRTGCGGCNIKTGNGMVKGDDPESMYWITSQRDLVDSCCFDYGNAETTSNDDGNGTMETLYFGGGVIWGTGYGGKPGPWIEADLENGLYAGWENGQDKNISTNKPLKFDFVNGILLGDTRDKNNGKGRFALYGGDATGLDATYGKLATMYDGIRPEKTGYVPMTKQGSLILSTGGDNSDSDGGRFYEGAMGNGVAVQATVDALQAAIVAAAYGK
jgi:hypothetical protein